jgi:nucleoside-diphosphate-sugar epimerase
MAKLAVIVGATGGQGNSVVGALLKDPSYKIRTVTRNPSSEKGKALSAQGVEVVAADLNDEASLVKAFSGASVIYGVTDFFEPFVKTDAEEAMKVEYRQGVNIVSAASETSSLEHFIWSTLPDSRKISNGEYVIPHFESKARIDAYIKENKPLLSKTTFLYVTYYAGNLLYPPLAPNFVKSSGKYVWFMPLPADTPLAHIGDHSTNIGVFAKAILAKGEQARGGKYVLASVQENTFGEALADWAKHTGKTDQTALVQISLEDCEVLWGKWGTEMCNMLKWWGIAKDQSWAVATGEPLLKAADLGLSQKDFVLPGKAWQAMDWSSI